MTHPQLLALSPILIVSATSVVVMLAIAIKRHHTFVASVSIAGLALALVSTAGVWPALATPRAIMALLIIDPFACFYLGVILIAALVVSALLHTYLGRYQGHREEMYLLLLLSTLGGMIMVASRHFVSFFIGLELDRKSVV